MFEDKINEDMKKLDPQAQEIKEQLEDEAPHGITVIIDAPLYGEILHYDMINEHWIRIGATMGYA